MHQHVRAFRAPFVCAVLGAAYMLTAEVALAAAPKISGTPVTTATVGVPWSFTPTASDADHNTLTFSIANKPGFASFSSTTGKVSGTPFAEHARTWSNIVISVSDGTTKVSLPAFSLIVKPNANKSPTISGTPPTTATVGTAYSFQPAAKDPEGKTVTFSISSKPSWAAFSTSTGRLTGTPTAAGSFDHISIAVTDGVSSASLPAFNILVSGSGGGTNSAPVISGTPPKTATVGTPYSWTPTASDPNSDPLTFSISGKPAWAAFDSKTGRLYGTPSASYAGTTSSSKISVTDGKATASLPTFSITVSNTGGGTTTGAVTLNWTPPTRNTDGTSLTNLAGYRIVYGTNANALSQTVQISSAGISTYVIDNLVAGTWYFGIKSYTSTGTESAVSSIATKTIQ